MKAVFKAVLTVLILVTAALESGAVAAWPYPVDLIQPDGSRITVTLHGDEFFNWMTCGGKVVRKAEDGFYREAPFDYAGEQRGRMMRAGAGMPRARVPYRTDVSRAPSMSIGDRHFLVLLIEFNDVEFTIGNPRQAFSALLNRKGYSENGATGSVTDYFSDQSEGKFTPVFDVVGPVKVRKNASEYASKDNGMNQDSGAPRLLEDACRILDASGFDFTEYDLDRDGYIDNIFFYYAGYNSAENNEGTIWPHKWQVNSAPVFDGVRLWSYACSSEYSGQKGYGRMCTIGTFCHEFAHVIGLPDFYDVNGNEEGSCPTPGIFSLMAYGNYNNGGNTPPYFSLEERALAGWIDGTDEIESHSRIMEGWLHIPELPAESGLYTLGPVHKNSGYRSPTDNENEYFLYEYRDGTSWDRYVGQGVLIYHVDKSGNMAGNYSAFKRWTDYGWSGCVNDAGTHPCYRLIPASGSSDGKSALFGNTVFAFTDRNKPGAKGWSEAPTWYNLTNIRHDGSAAKLTLSYDGPGSPFAVPAIDIGDSSWKDGDTFEFRLMKSPDMPEQTVWYFDGEQQSETQVTLRSGIHRVEARIVFKDGRSGWYRAEIDVL